MVESLTCNQVVVGSSPMSSSILYRRAPKLESRGGLCQSSLKVKRCVHTTTSLGMQVQDLPLAPKSVVND